MASDNKPWIMILIAVVIADVVASFETMMVIATLKALFKEFGDAAGVGWMVTAYLLVAAGSAAVCGRLGDMYGRKRMIIITLGIATLGSLISALSSQLELVIAGRALQGISTAVFPLSYGVLRASLPAERVASAGGFLMSSNSIGAMLGLFLGGILVDQFSWRIVFLASATFTGFAILLTWLCLPSETVKRPTSNIDILGGVLFAPAIAALLLAISNAPQWGWLDKRTIGLCVGTAVLLAWWIRHELRHPDPLLDVRLLARKDIAISNFVMALVALGTLQLTIVIMLFLQQSPATGIGLGLTATAAAAIKLPANMGAIAAAPLAGHLCRTLGERAIIQIGLLANVVAWTMLFFVHDNIWLVFLATLLSTVGTTVTYVGIATNVTLSAPTGRTSEANGVTVAVRSIGNACGAQIVAIMLGGAVLAEQKAGAANLAPAGYYRSFAFILALSVLGLLVARALPSKRTPDATAGT